MNPRSPNIFNGVPPEMVGAVDAYATLSAEDHRMGLERLYNHWAKNGVEFIDNLSATEFHAKFGLEGTFDSVVQTGVMVLSPRLHKELFEHIYNSYDDNGEAYWNYEMRPMSFEILSCDLAYWRSPTVQHDLGPHQAVPVSILRHRGLVDSYVLALPRLARHRWECLGSESRQIR